MWNGSGHRALSLAYLAPYSVVAVCLILLGFVVERSLPASLAGRYRRSMFSVLSTLARPVDGLTEGSPGSATGGVIRERPP